MTIDELEALDAAAARANGVLDTAAARSIRPTIARRATLLTPRRRLILAGVAVAAVVAGVVAIGRPAIEDQAAAPQLPPPLRLILDPVPPGMEVGEFVPIVSQPPTIDDIVVRVYATASESPGRDPFVWLGGVPGGQNIVENVIRLVGGREVTVQGRPAVLADPAGDGQAVYGKIDETDYIVLTRNLSELETLAVAETVGFSADGFGLVIDPASVPGDVHERLVTTLSAGFEMADLSRELRGVAVVWRSADLSTTDMRRFEIRSVNADAVDFPLLRAAIESTTSVDIRGHEGFTNAVGSDGTPMATWVEQGHVVHVSAQGFTRTEMLKLIERLRPATDAEWEQLSAIELAVAVDGDAPANTEAAPVGTDPPQATVERGEVYGTLAMLDGAIADVSLRDGQFCLSSAVGEVMACVPGPVSLSPAFFVSHESVLFGVVDSGLVLRITVDGVEQQRVAVVESFASDRQPVLAHIPATGRVDVEVLSPIGDVIERFEDIERR